MELKGCIFDLDGVIVDTAKYHYLAWKRLAAELGFEFSEEHNEALKGVSRMASLEILLRVGGIKVSDERKHELAERKNRWYVEYISDMTPDEILPGSVEFLKLLRKEGIQPSARQAGMPGQYLTASGFAVISTLLLTETKYIKLSPTPKYLSGGRKR